MQGEDREDARAGAAPALEPGSAGAGEQDAEVQFETALAELEALVERMEAGELSLEESLETYERGVRLSRACQQALAKAEQRIRILTEQDGREIATEPFEAEDD